MPGHLLESLKIAKDEYGYVSPENPGTLPRGLIINNKKYVLFTKTHTAVCDNKACQKQFINYSNKHASSIKYITAPIYSFRGRHELCVKCADVKTAQTFVPPKEDIMRMLLILGYSEEMCQESDYEGDSGMSDEDNNGNEGDDEMSDGDSGMSDVGDKDVKMVG